MDYQIEIKQIVDYPRCRIYRSFFITWSFARLRTSEAPTGALRESPI